MIDATNIPSEKLKMTVRMMRDEAAVRGWKAWLYYIGCMRMRLQRPDGKKIEVFSSSPSSMSCTSYNDAKDKFMAYLILKEAGLPQPETYMAASLQEASDYTQKITTQGKAVVIKPHDSAHGNGITVGLKSVEELEPALNQAKKYSNKVIIQECIDVNVDVRIACIDYKAVASLVRVPARIKGDGQHTITELIDIENANPSRGKNYKKALNIIDKMRAQLYLKDKIYSIPKAGEYVQVVGTANVGTGGETVDVTDDMPQFVIDMAEKAAKAFSLPVCGIDFLLSRMPKSTDTPNTLECVIIEANSCPALFLHETPTVGKPRSVIKAYLDYLETL